MLLYMTTLVALMWLPPYTGGADLVQTLYSKLNNAATVQSGAGDGRIENVESLTECAVHCGSVNGCSALQFESSQKTCLLHKWPRVQYAGSGTGGGTGSGTSGTSGGTSGGTGSGNSGTSGTSGSGTSPLWMAQDVKVFLATRTDGSELLYTQAEELCSSVGGHIADHFDVYDAHAMGFNLCRCGWTQGGIIRMVLTESDPQCPNSNGGTGVISCKWTDVATDSFCSLN